MSHAADVARSVFSRLRTICGVNLPTEVLDHKCACHFQLFHVVVDDFVLRVNLHAKVREVEAHSLEDAEPKLALDAADGLLRFEVDLVEKQPRDVTRHIVHLVSRPTLRVVVVALAAIGAIDPQPGRLGKKSGTLHSLVVLDARELVCVDVFGLHFCHVLDSMVRELHELLRQHNRVQVCDRSHLVIHD